MVVEWRHLSRAYLVVVDQEGKELGQGVVVAISLARGHVGSQQTREEGL